MTSHNELVSTEYPLDVTNNAPTLIETQKDNTYAVTLVIIID